MENNNLTIIIMKIKHLFIGMLAVAAAVACNRKEEPVVEPKLDVDKTAVEVAATAGEASFNVTSNQPWDADCDADWISIDPASGSASNKAVAVKVTAEDNKTAQTREATVTVKAGELTKTVKVAQAAGKAEEPTPEPEPDQPLILSQNQSQNQSRNQNQSLNLNRSQNQNQNQNRSQNLSQSRNQNRSQNQSQNLNRSRNQNRNLNQSQNRNQNQNRSCRRIAWSQSSS